MNDTSTPAAEPALAALLRSATSAQHARAEGTSFVGDLVEGRLDVAAHADLLTQLHGVYVALERAAEALRHDAVGGRLVVDALARTAAIEGDLDLLRPAWRTASLLPAARRYASRVTEVAGDVTGYVAHAYTRYLGDLSGGQMIRGAVRRSYGVADDALGFYAFPGIPKPKLFKDDYRARLDALPLDVAGRRAVVEEARYAFDLNTALLTELGEAHPARAAVTSVTV